MSIIDLSRVNRLLRFFNLGDELYGGGAKFRVVSERLLCLDQDALWLLGIVLLART